MGQNTNIINSVVTVGNGNIVQAHIHKDPVNWDLLENELFEMIHKLPKDSNELNSVKDAYKYTIKKDRNNLINFIKTHAIDFTSNLFSNAASVFLVEFIKKCV
ncbi:hypothetical protein HNQ80_000196 [Anaerosolibacter carboniphilus]|uniref:Uncharacterized protein n=1 Tax=Anaerosolibacter carboniphilus TaxID=1417629 RepID=A0A841KL06_9FIRM|nr:hypothetical protein [Anaerosolibacter carboniphilus]MBB6214127.1 hypothetical protein [Anaerosolibacter carboniphilus]